uniref:Uncharacterized protein n=1 Tax=Arundo donax TaxID=35708 RepID=A0A0A9D6B5_ARUDO
MQILHQGSIFFFYLLPSDPSCC